MLNLDPLSETLDHLYKGQAVLFVHLYENGHVVIAFDSGCMLSIHATDENELDIEIGGPEAPEREMLRDLWTEEEDL